MKRLLFTLLLAAFCATGYAQTIKSLGYNTTNGKIGYAGTNPLTFTNTVFFGDDVSINPSAGINYGGSEVMNLEERTLTGDWLVAGGLSFFNATNAATTRTNLGLGATWLTNTNVTNFRTAIGLGATNDVYFNTIEADNFTITGSNQLTVPSLFLNGPIEWNEAADASTTRTNLSLPLPALTNTSNVTMMRALAGSTNTNTPFSGNIDIVDGNEDIHNVTISNGIILDWQAP
jgi:hypothetical protein